MSSDPNLNPSLDNQVEGEGVTKSKNQLKNEAKRAEKLKKFEEKQDQVWRFGRKGQQEQSQQNLSKFRKRHSTRSGR